MSQTIVILYFTSDDKFYCKPPDGSEECPTLHHLYDDSRLELAPLFITQ